MNIKGLDKAAILAALWNAAIPKELAFLAGKVKEMTVEEAQAILDSGETYFDYLQARCLKIDLGCGDELETRLYNRDHGQGAAEAVIGKLVPAPKMYLAGKLKYPMLPAAFDDLKARVAAGRVFAEVDRPVRLPGMSDVDWAARYTIIDEMRICAQITQVEVDAHGWVSVAIKPCGPQGDVFDEGSSFSFGVRAVYANERSMMIVTIDLTGVDLEA